MTMALMLDDIIIQLVGSNSMTICIINRILLIIYTLDWLILIL